MPTRRPPTPEIGWPAARLRGSELQASGRGDDLCRTRKEAQAVGPVERLDLRPAHDACRIDQEVRAELGAVLGKDRLVTLSKSEDAVARDNARRALEILNQPSL